MRFIASCEACIGRIAEFPTEVDAEAFVRRHHNLVGHSVLVTRVLDTPFEGLLT